MDFIIDEKLKESKLVEPSKKEAHELILILYPHERHTT